MTSWLFPHFDRYNSFHFLRVYFIVSVQEGNLLSVANVYNYYMMRQTRNLLSSIKLFLQKNKKTKTQNKTENGLHPPSPDQTLPPYQKSISTIFEKALLFSNIANIDLRETPAGKINTLIQAKNSKFSVQVNSHSQSSFTTLDISFGVTVVKYVILNYVACRTRKTCSLAPAKLQGPLQFERSCM